MNTNLAYQEEIWDEMLNGRIVMMSPRPVVNHNRIASNIYRILSDYLEGKKCEPFSDGIDLYLSKKDRFIPDGMIVCDPNKIKSRGVFGAPDLVVEVLSPSTAKNDRGYKKDVYAKYGVKDYWTAVPETKSIEQYLLTDGQLLLNEIYTIPPDYFTEEECAEFVQEFRCSLYDDLLIKLADIFKRVN